MKETPIMDRAGWDAAPLENGIERLPHSRHVSKRGAPIGNNRRSVRGELDPERDLVMRDDG